MAERRLHLPSLLGGLLALGISASYLLDLSDAVELDGRVVAAGILVLLGLGGVAASVRQLLLSRSRQE